MWEIIKSIITSPAGSFAFVATIIYFIGWGISKISQVYTIAKFKSSSVDKLETNLDSIKEDIQIIKASLAVMQTKKASLTKSHSPVSLTSLGKDLAKEMDIDTKVANNWDNIYDYIHSKMSQRNAYDIQQFCIDTATISLDKFFLPEDLSKIKMYAYQNGNPIAYYGSMIGVIIRDKYFQTLGIDVADVDKCAPQSEGA